MKRTVFLTTLAAAALWATPRAEANPVMICMPGPVTEQPAQTAVVEFEIDASFVTDTLEVYRDVPGADSGSGSPTAVKVATLTAQDGTASSADTGSGVVSTLQFTVEEACVPLGSWQWDVFVDGNSVWCEMSGTIETANPACTGAGGGGTGGSGTGGAGASATGGAGGNGAAGAAVPDDPDDDVVVQDGCSVRSPQQGGAAGAAWLGLALGLGLGLRRRRR